MDCWAEALGDCSKEGSKEHLLTAALFSGGSVTVKGFPWCRAAPRKIGVSAFSCQMLCKKHNNEVLHQILIQSDGDADLHGPPCGVAKGR